jgi:hypothetical protein
MGVCPPPPYRRTGKPLYILRTYLKLIEEETAIVNENRLQKFRNVVVPSV